MLINYFLLWYYSMELLKFLSTFYYIFRIYFFHHLKIFILFLFFKKILPYFILELQIFIKIHLGQYYFLLNPITLFTNSFAKIHSIPRLLLIVIINQTKKKKHQLFKEIEIILYRYHLYATQPMLFYHFEPIALIFN
jgi:hypothetical protein